MFYRVQIRNYVPYESKNVFTDSQIVFNSKEAMDTFVSNWKKHDYREIAQTEVCEFNAKGILAKKRVLKNFLANSTNEDEDDE